MKLKDLINAINEMAMTNYGRYGDFDKSNAFPNKKDQELIKSEKHFLRTEDAFKNLKQNINCYFVADKIFSDGEKSVESVKYNIDLNTDQYIPLKNEILKNYENSITFIFAGNRNAEGFVGSTKATPLTGWANAHKVAHMLDEQSTEVMDEYQVMLGKIINILNGSRGISLSTLSGVEKLRLMNKLVPAASGRKNKIPNRVEFLNELISIWIWYGHARVADITDEIFDVSFIDKDRATYIKDSIEQIINDTMHKIFEKMVGHIYVVPQ